MSDQKQPIVLLENQAAILEQLLNVILHEGMDDIELEQITEPGSPDLHDLRVMLHDVAGDETVWAIGTRDEQARRIKRSVSASVSGDEPGFTYISGAATATPGIKKRS